MAETEEIKFCPKCGSNKPLSEFHVIRGVVTDWCMMCLQAETKRMREQDALNNHRRKSWTYQADKERLYRVYKGRCYYCGCELKGKYDVDHYIPVSRGGGTGLENLVIACPTCNRSKGSKMPADWMRGQGKLC